MVKSVRKSKKSMKSIRGGGLKKKTKSFRLKSRSQRKRGSRKSSKRKNRSKKRQRGGSAGAGVNSSPLPTVGESKGKIEAALREETEAGLREETKKRIKEVFDKIFESLKAIYDIFKTTFKDTKITIKESFNKERTIEMIYEEFYKQYKKHYGELPEELKINGSEKGESTPPDSGESTPLSEEDKSIKAALDALHTECFYILTPDKAVTGGLVALRTKEQGIHPPNLNKLTPAQRRGTEPINKSHFTQEQTQQDTKYSAAFEKEKEKYKGLDTLEYDQSKLQELLKYLEEMKEKSERLLALVNQVKRPQ